MKDEKVVILRHDGEKAVNILRQRPADGVVNDFIQSVHCAFMDSLRF